MFGQFSGLLRTRRLCLEKEIPNLSHCRKQCAMAVQHRAVALIRLSSSAMQVWVVFACRLCCMTCTYMVLYLLAFVGVRHSLSAMYGVSAHLAHCYLILVIL